MLILWPLALALAAHPIGGDSAKKTAPETSLPILPTRHTKFTTDEGTWMSLDVSPDGKSVVFDLVGDLYTVPITGGTATRITSGMGFDGQPRFSPDGKSVVYVTDRTGYENLWLVDADGHNPRSLTSDKDAQYISPAWTPDGQYLVVSRNKTGILGSKYDLVLLNASGGKGIVLTTPPKDGPPPSPNAPPPFDNYLGAAFGKDPRYIYASVKHGRFQYNQMLSDAWQVGVYDRVTGKTFVRTTNIGGGIRPTLSRDGHWLAFASRRDGITGLKLRDLESGDEVWLVDHITRDDMESRYTRDILPGFAFTPDSKAIVISYGGKIWKVDVATKAATPVPFTADVDIEMGPLVKFAYPIDDSVLTVRQIREARPSPDGKTLAFTALDRLWLTDLGCTTCRPRRVTDFSLGEYSPSWSPDGKYLAFVTWSEDGGDVWRIRTDVAKAKPEKLSRHTAFYENLAYDPTGHRLVVARGPHQQRTERENEFAGPGPQVLELVWLPAAGGEATVITPLNAYGQPHFTRDTTRIYFNDPNEGLVSVRWDGTDRRVHLKVTGYVSKGFELEDDNRQLTEPQPQPEPAEDIVISPDSSQAIALVNRKVYLVAVPITGGQTPTVSVESADDAPVPLRRLTRVGGDFLGWSPNGKSVYWSLGRSFFTYDLAAATAAVNDSTTKAKGDTSKKADTAAMPHYAYTAKRFDITMVAPKDRPSGSVVLTGARIVTMKGDEIIPEGDIVVTNNRIAAIGASGSVTVPSGAKRIDVHGKTIIPGYIDIHAHMWPTWGVHKSQVYEYLANLAYGVTTTRDPQTSTTDVLTYGDLVETGELIGPRIFTTGPGVFWTDEVSSQADAREVLTRYSDFYQTHTLKQYMVGDRMQRQWTLIAAKEQGITPTLEGGLDFRKNMTEAIDGYAGSEHAYAIMPLYKDIVQLVASSGITYTPTLLVEYGGPWAENYWYEHYDVHNDAKLRRFTPHDEVDRRSLRRPGWFADSQYSFPNVAAQAAKIVAAGGRVGLGGHGQLQGLGDHFELWSIASGGMPPHDVLRVGTIFGAQAIGIDKDLGSLEVGKLADLQVLDKNPLDDIRNTNTILYVMKNGRLYEGATLKEIYPREREIPPLYWWRPAEQ
ncbi:MAG TPA: amidohydrolase family protein [Gemmatimonadaceae bacterium]|nr:amidohydrolase family protein [Gemmatimonadaceae bacterium]